MAPLARRKGQVPIVFGMVAIAACGIFLSDRLAFLSGVGLGIALPSFFLGFGSLKRR